MNKISVETYIKNINYIYNKKPTYKWATDGFDYCDCIGMPKRALKMANITPSGLSGTNYAARYTIRNLKHIDSVNQLRIGDVVLKGRPYNPKDKYLLPAKYLPGGDKYNGDTTNYVHIGTVTNINPLEITHMTSPTAKKDKELGDWNYFGQLPHVSYEEEIDKVVVHVEYATVVGGSLNMRSDSSANSSRLAVIPNNAKIAVIEKGSVWCKAVYNAYTGYVMTKYLNFETETKEDNITISLTRECATALYQALKQSLGL